METLQCPSCDHTLPIRAFYCSQCRSQLKCKSCSEPLEKNAMACIMCGEVVDKIETDNRKDSHDNVFEYEESIKHRKIKASFSNEVGNTFGSALGYAITGKQIFMGRSSIAPKASQAVSGQLPIFNNTEEVDATDVTNHLINSLFKVNADSKVVLDETRLKAKGKLDYAKRATYMLLLYNYINNLSPFSKAEIISFIDTQGVNDGHFQSWLTNNKGDFDYTGDKISLLAPGRDNAEQFLNEIKDPLIPNTWDPSLYKNKTRKEKAFELEKATQGEENTKSDNKKGSRSYMTPTAVEIDLYPKT